LGINVFQNAFCLASKLAKTCSNGLYYGLSKSKGTGFSEVSSDSFEAWWKPQNKFTTKFRSSENKFKVCREWHSRQRFAIACFRCVVVGENLKFMPKNLRIGARFQGFLLTWSEICSISKTHLLPSLDKLVINCPHPFSERSQQVPRFDPESCFGLFLRSDAYCVWVVIERFQVQGGYIKFWRVKLWSN
jgi:hypothetical protein